MSGPSNADASTERALVIHAAAPRERGSNTDWTRALRSNGDLAALDTCDRHGRYMQTLRHLVCGTDFSQCADHALETAVELAAASATRITLVHVCELGVDESVDNLDDRRLVECGEMLARVVARYRQRNVEVAGVLRSGKPWTKLDNVAAEVGASLIVIGRQGAGRGQRVELGSVAVHLVRTASRPVLTVPYDFDRLNPEVDETNRSNRKNKTS